MDAFESGDHQKGQRISIVCNTVHLLKILCIRHVFVELVFSLIVFQADCYILDFSFPEKIGQGDDLGIDSLIPDLLQYVREDNEKFLAEIQAWDAEQRRKNQPTVADTSLMEVEAKPSELFNGLFSVCVITIIVVLLTKAVWNSTEFAA